MKIYKLKPMWVLTAMMAKPLPVEMQAGHLVRLWRERHGVILDFEDVKRSLSVGARFDCLWVGLRGVN